MAKIVKSIKERLFIDIIKIEQTAEHNQRMYDQIMDRAQLFRTQIKILKRCRVEHEDFFSEDNCNNLKKFDYVYSKIHNYRSDYSNLNMFRKLLQAKGIRKSLIYLN